MSFDAINGSEIANRARSAQAAAAAGGVLASIPVRPRTDTLDSTQTSRRPLPGARDRFQVGQSTEDPPSRSSRPATGDTSASRNTDAAVSTFVAQSLAQDGASNDNTAIASEIRVGIEAYRRAAGPDTPTEETAQVDILPPSGAPLSSGHRLDLSI